MGSLFSNLLSNRTLFFDLFDRAANNIVDMAAILVDMASELANTDRDNLVKQIDKLDNLADALTHKIYLNLDRIVFTPLNRNDIHQLAATIDDVADTVKEASSRIYLYNIVEVAPALKAIAHIVLKASQEICKAVKLLRTSKKPDEVLEICRKVKNYERESTEVYHIAIAGLFANEKDAITLIKYREVLLSMETAVNKCKRVSDALNAVLINNL